MSKKPDYLTLCSIQGFNKICKEERNELEV
jgi:hypothetical protein|nr:MAG TPA: hypothetical protein [Caudoviricetes sp.]